MYRKILFFLVDFLNKKSLTKEYSNVAILNSAYLDKFNVDYRNDLLKKLLEHAYETVPFYKNEKQKLNSLEDFPLINKNTIRDNFELFKSSSYLTKNVFLVSTSGSTGVPFTVLQDKRKQLRNKADVLFYAKKANYDLGDKLFYIKIWSKKGFLFNIKNYIKNLFPFSVYDLTKEEIPKLIEKIKNTKEDSCIMAYSSSIRIICNYLDSIHSDSINSNLKSIITISERLDSNTKERAQHYFKCPVYSRYSNNENGILAQQDIYSDKFSINWASYFIEILDLNSNVSAPYGKPGRVVVTDLFNYAMPLIRYDTGDVAIMDIDENDVPCLQRVEGRVLDVIYNTNGNMVSSHLAYHLCKYGNFKQFQLAQLAKKEYRIQLNTETPVVNQETMLEEFKGYLGTDAIIKVEYVDDIPILASGKRREVANFYTTA